MLKKYQTIFLAGLLIFGGSSTLIFAQAKTNDISNAEKVKAAVLKRGAVGKKPVRVKLTNGTKLKGYITETGEDSFTLTDSKTRQPTVIAYRDAERVEGRGLSGGARIGIIIGAAAGATLLALYLAFLNALKDS